MRNLKMFVAFILLSFVIGIVHCEEKINDPSQEQYQYELHVASFEGRADRVRELLSNPNLDIENRIALNPQSMRSRGCKYCDANENVDNGTTALHWATKGKHLGIAEMLIKKGADVNARRSDGWTPLHYAANGGSVLLVKLLVENGAELNPRMKEFLATPLHFAANKNHNLVVQYLLEKGAEVDPKNHIKRTPLYDACLNGGFESVELLVENGANITSAGEDGSTPWHAANIGGHLEMVKYLKGKGVDVNLKRNENAIALHDATYFGKYELVEYLLENGAFIDQVTDDFKATPIHAAVMTREEKIINLLMDWGANLSPRLENGESVFDIALREDLSHVVNRLDEKKMDTWTIGEVCQWISQLESKHRVKPRKFHDAFRIAKVNGKTLHRSKFSLKNVVGIEDEKFQQILTKEIELRNEYDIQIENQKLGWIGRIKRWISNFGQQESKEDL